MKKNVLPVLIISGLIVVVLVFIGVSAVIDSLTPTTERADLTEYFEITEESQVAITLDDDISDTHATLINGEVYVDYKFIYNNLSSRFYWDANENILLYTTASDIISAEAEATSYMTGKSSTDFGKTIVKATADSALVHLDFVSKFADIRVSYYSEPNHVVITKTWGDVSVASAKNDTPVRLEAHIKSPILSDVAKGTTVTIIEKGDEWHKVASSDGFIGYVESKNFSAISTETLVCDKPAEVFHHMKMDKPVNLLWHQTMNATANTKISTILSESKGVNVVSPTWFKVKDNEGNISSIASKDYVDYCHNQGVKVWGLVSDFELDDVDIKYVLTHTSTRQNLVNQLIAKALQYNLDGINIDFEAMRDQVTGNAYIQFLRELSIKCENNDLVLSTDVMEPTRDNNYVFQYGEQVDFVDYVILMAYDEHRNQSTGAGSVASLNWSEEAVIKLLDEGVPADQVVLGIPFYTKIWSLTPTTGEDGAEITYVIGFEIKGMDTAKNWMTSNVDSNDIIWLEDCGQYYGEVTKKGVIYKLWLEDTTSLEKRLQMMQSHNLAGAAFWKSGFEGKDAWNLIIKYIN